MNIAEVIQIYPVRGDRYIPLEIRPRGVVPEVGEVIRVQTADGEADALVVRSELKDPARTGGIVYATVLVDNLIGNENPRVSL